MGEDIVLHGHSAGMLVLRKCDDGSRAGVVVKPAEMLDLSWSLDLVRMGQETETNQMKQEKIERSDAILARGGGDKKIVDMGPDDGDAFAVAGDNTPERQGGVEVVANKVIGDIVDNHLALEQIVVSKRAEQ
jgi:hypothetical protein